MTTEPIPGQPMVDAIEEMQKHLRRKQRYRLMVKFLRFKMGVEGRLYVLTHHRAANREDTQ
jgi:UDP-N-acetylglucosamine 2-epimerase